MSEPSEPQADAPPEEAAPAPRQIAVGDIEVPVLMSLGEVKATIGLLETIQAGYVFELDRVAGAEVGLSVNGARIGEGELVRVGDKLGVRVVKVHEHAAGTTGTDGDAA